MENLTRSPFLLRLAILRLPGPQFKLFYDSVVWAIKHTMRDIADMGLNIALELLAKFETVDQEMSNAFFQQYLISILQDIFYVLTDTSHKSGFKLQTQILQKLFVFVERNLITVPIFPEQVATGKTNSDTIKEHLVTLLCGAFPNLTQ